MGSMTELLYIQEKRSANLQKITNMPYLNPSMWGGLTNIVGYYQVTVDKCKRIENTKVTIRANEGSKL